MLFKYLTIFSAVALLVACQQINLPQGDYQQLTASTTQKPLLIALQDGKISGFTGCNNAMGEYTLVKGQLVVSQLASTMKACEPAKMQREQQFSQFLQSKPKVTIDGKILTLSKNDMIYQFSLRSNES